MARSFATASSQYLSNATNITGGVFTAAIWIYPLSSSANYAWMQQWNNIDGHKHWYLLTLSGAVYFGRSTDGIIAANIITAANATADAWHSIVARFSNGVGWSVFLNGTKTDGTSPGTIFTGGTPGVTIGGMLNYAGYVNGRTAYAALWNEYLTDDECLSYHRGFHPRHIRVNNLIAQWDMGGHWGRNDLDPVGGYHMTANNSPTFADSPRVYYPSPVVLPPRVVAAATNRRRRIICGSQC